MPPRTRQSPPSVVTVSCAGSPRARPTCALLSAGAARKPSASLGFASDIAPILSRIGCNGSSCHGTLTGQSGFKLSLFGYDPDADYDAIVTKSDGRRINRAEPDKSLLLRKPS